MRRFVYGALGCNFANVVMICCTVIYVRRGIRFPSRPCIFACVSHFCSCVTSVRNKAICCLQSKTFILNVLLTQALFFHNTGCGCNSLKFCSAKAVLEKAKLQRVARWFFWVGFWFFHFPCVLGVCWEHIFPSRVGFKWRQQTSVLILKEVSNVHIQKDGVEKSRNRRKPS